MKLDPKHLRIEAGYSKRPGEQSVGMPSTSVRVTHVPSGLVAVCDCERSQMKNKNACLAMIEYCLAELGWKELES